MAASVTTVYVPSVRQTERNLVRISQEVVRCTENPSEGVLILDVRHLTTDF